MTEATERACTMYIYFSLTLYHDLRSQNVLWFSVLLFLTLI